MITNNPARLGTPDEDGEQNWLICRCLTRPHAISTPASTSNRPRPAAAVLAAPGDWARNEPNRMLFPLIRLPLT
jgi:hypothetical protein